MTRQALWYNARMISYCLIVGEKNAALDAVSAFPREFIIDLVDDIATLDALLKKGGLEHHLILADESICHDAARYVHSQETGMVIYLLNRSEEPKLSPYCDLSIDAKRIGKEDLARLVYESYLAQNEGKMHVVFSSSGTKWGLPLDVKNCFDCRHLPNPFWVDSLKLASGLDDSVSAWMSSFPETQDFLENVSRYLDAYFEQAKKEGRKHISVNFICTGGKHRSVYCAEKIYALYKDRYTCSIFHHERKEGKFA